MLDSRAITLMNALRKWGVLSADNFTFHMLIEYRQFEKWHHQMSDLYIFVNVELTKLINK